MSFQKLNLKWFLLPAALIITGAFLLSLALGGIVDTATAERHPLDPAGVTTLTLTGKGRYEIYYEYHTVPTLQQSIVFSFENHDTGSVTQSAFPSGNNYYSLGDVKGEMIAYAYLEPGTYDIRSNYRDDGENHEILLTAGSMGSSIVSSVFQLLGGIFCLVTGVIALVILLVLRFSHRRRPGNGYDPY